MEILDDIKYVGVNDHKIDLFEGQYKVPKGMAYNSYVIIDERIAVFDTVDKNFTDEWLDNIQKALGDRQPDFLIVQHMEPDHSANIANFISIYKDAFIVASDKAFMMMKNFFGNDFVERQIRIANGDQLDLGKHKLKFVSAPMVHWPEVMMTYDETDKLFFSADAFGKFGALDINEDWLEEARRYYIGIVGKYGTQVQNLLKKVSGLEINMILPLHGPLLKDNLAYYINLYNIWSSYEAEKDGIVICYTSVYGHTKKGIDLLVNKLKENNISDIKTYDLARCDMSKAVSDAFAYSRIILATTTYNADIYPFMKEFINHLIERNFQNKYIGIIENGSWAPMAAKTIKEMFEKSKNIFFLEPIVTIKSALNIESENKIEELAEKISNCQIEKDSLSVNEDSLNNDTDIKKKYVCKICGYVYEGNELPEDFICPLCKHGADDFEEIK